MSGLIRFVFVVASSMVFGAIVLAACQALGLQIPIPLGLVMWLPGLLGVDGESAENAAYFAFFLDCVGLAILAHVVWIYLDRHTRLS